MEIGEWKDALSIAHTVAISMLAVGQGIVMWVMRGRKEDRAEIAALGGRVVQLTRDLDRVEVTVKSMPTHDHLARVYDELRDTNENLNRMIGEMGATRRSVDLLIRHMAEGRTQ